jgi:hypothetical protein
VRRGNGEELKGISMEDSPAAEAWRGDRNLAGGGARGGWRLGFKGGGAPAFLRRREAVEYVRLGVAVLLALSSSPEGALSRKSTTAAAALGSAPARRRGASRARRGAATVQLGHASLARGLNRGSRPARAWRARQGRLAAAAVSAMDTAASGSGPGWAKAGRGWTGGRDGSGLQARPGRIGFVFVFFRIYF